MNMYILAIGISLIVIIIISILKLLITSEEWVNEVIRKGDNKMNREVIKNNKKCFDWWIEKPGRTVWVRPIHGGLWARITPGWNSTSKIYVQDDEYAEFRKAIADGKGVYLIDEFSEYNKTKVIFGYYPPECYHIGKPRWRAHEGNTYWTIDCLFNVIKCGEAAWGIDNERHKLGNYFKTCKEAKRVASKLKETFKEIRNE